MSSADHDLRNVKYSSLPTDPQSPSREAEVTFTDEDASWAWRPRTSEEGNTSYDTSLDAVELNIEAPSPGRIGDTGVLSRCNRVPCDECMSVLVFVQHAQ